MTNNNSDAKNDKDQVDNKDVDSQQKSNNESLRDGLVWDIHLRESNEKRVFNNIYIAPVKSSGSYSTPPFPFSIEKHIASNNNDLDPETLFEESIGVLRSLAWSLLNENNDKPGDVALCMAADEAKEYYNQILEALKKVIPMQVTNGNKVQFEYPSDAEYEKGKKEFADTLSQINLKAEKSPHKAVWKPILANIALCCIGLGILAIGFKLVHSLVTKGVKNTTHRDVFLFGHHKRKEAVSAISECFEKAKIASDALAVKIEQNKSQRPDNSK